MEFWQVVSWCETGDLVEVARIAEETGFDGLILAEHVFYPHRVDSVYPYAPDGRSPMSDELEFPDPLIAFAAAAAVTRRLRFMTGVYLLGLRHPVEAARNDRDIFCALAERAGFEAGFTEGLDETAWLRQLYDSARAKTVSAGIEMPPFEVFWERGHVELPPPTRDFVLFEDFRNDPAAHPLRAQDGLYVYDTVQRLYDSRFGDGDIRDIRKYIKLGPLWRAFRSEARTVLLIDEVDKADLEFPNDLLHELDAMRFRIDETGREIVAPARQLLGRPAAWGSASTASSTARQ